MLTKRNNARYKFLSSFLGCALFFSCSSTQLISDWKNPEIGLFHADQVLIVGMAQDMEVRLAFETKLQEEFAKRKITAIRSVDLFDVAFTSSEKSEEELTEVEQDLLAKGFDAILFTKIIGWENKQTFRKKMQTLSEFYISFGDDYLDHQGIYYDREYSQSPTIYHAETSLYCICVDKERALIWRGNIDVWEPINLHKVIGDYSKIIVSTFKEQQLVINE